MFPRSGRLSVVKTGQQVHLKFSPDVKGTISAVERGRVRVTWPRRWATVDKQMTRLPRERVWYDSATALKALAW